jgi:hypothetical protein
MPFRALDPESSVSTNSTTWAGGGLREAPVLTRLGFGALGSSGAVGALRTQTVGHRLHPEQCLSAEAVTSASVTLLFLVLARFRLERIAIVLRDALPS